MCRGCRSTPRRWRRRRDRPADRRLGVAARHGPLQRRVRTRWAAGVADRVASHNRNRSRRLVVVRHGSRYLEPRFREGAVDLAPQVLQRRHGWVEGKPMTEQAEAAGVFDVGGAPRTETDRHGPVTSHLCFGGRRAWVESIPRRAEIDRSVVERSTRAEQEALRLPEQRWVDKPQALSARAAAPSRRPDGLDKKRPVGEATPAGRAGRSPRRTDGLDK